MGKVNRVGRRPLRCSARQFWAAGLTVCLVISAARAEAQPVRTYTVKKGDTLSHIALKKLKAARKWGQLYRWNRAVVGKNPHLIYPGQVIVLSSAPSKAKRPTAIAKTPVRSNAGPTPSPRPQTPSQAIHAAPVLEPPALPQVEASALPAVEPPAPQVVDAPGAVPPSDRELELPEIPREWNLSDKPAFDAGPNPWLAAGASTLFPGAGQAMLGDWGRGGLYAGTAVLLFGTGLYGLNHQNAPLARTSSYALMALSLLSPLDAFFSATSRTDAESEARLKEARK